MNVTDQRFCSGLCRSLGDDVACVEWFDEKRSPEFVVNYQTEMSYFPALPDVLLW